ncbi:MAG: enoyl-CoA hydratase-related protein [Gammaproteobacteria bacterium]
MKAKRLTLTINTQGIAELTLQRPEKNNALDDKMIIELQSVFKKLQKDPKVYVVILAGAGKHFCAGADIEWLQRLGNASKKENIEDAMQLARLLRIMYTFDKPLIALVQGAAMGGGIGLISCCDIAVGTPDTYFSFSEVKLGLVPATIGPYVIEVIGARVARRYFLTGEQFEAKKAQRWNLLQQIVPAEDLSAAGYALAEMLLENAPNAVQAAKRLIQLCRPFHKKLFNETTALLAEIRTSDEAHAGLKAFLSKSLPYWKRRK